MCLEHLPNLEGTPIDILWRAFIARGSKEVSHQIVYLSLRPCFPLGLFVNTQMKLICCFFRPIKWSDCQQCCVTSSDQELLRRLVSFQKAHPRRVLEKSETTVTAVVYQGPDLEILIESQSTAKEKACCSWQKDQNIRENSLKEPILVASFSLFFLVFYFYF